MTNEKKLTKVQKFEIIAQLEEVKADPMLADFIAREIELLKSKKPSERKPSATQIANHTLVKEIHEQMEAEKTYSVSDLIKTIPACAGLSNQKVSALTRLMVNDKLVEKIVEKRQSKFRKVLAPQDEE